MSAISVETSVVVTVLRDVFKMRTPDGRQKLLNAAIADRDARPWRYYRLEYDTLKKLCEQLADKVDELKCQLEDLRKSVSGE